MRVFRVERRETGMGPFRLRDTIRVMDRAIGVVSYHNRFPTSYAAGLRLSEGVTPYHAAPSIRALLRWFPRPIRRALAERGFHLVELEVSGQHVEADDLQAVYDPSQARVIASYPLAT